MKSLRNIVLSTMLTVALGCASTQPNYDSLPEFLMFKASSELSSRYNTDTITIFYKDRDGNGSLSGLDEITTVVPQRISKEEAYQALMDIKR